MPQRTDHPPPSMRKITPPKSVQPSTKTPRKNNAAPLDASPGPICIKKSSQSVVPGRLIITAEYEVKEEENEINPSLALSEAPSSKRSLPEEDSEDDQPAKRRRRDSQRRSVRRIEDEEDETSSEGAVEEYDEMAIGAEVSPWFSCSHYLTSFRIIIRRSTDIEELMSAKSSPILGHLSNVPVLVYPQALVIPQARSENKVSKEPQLHLTVE